MIRLFSTTLNKNGDKKDLGKLYQGLFLSPHYKKVVHLTNKRLFKYAFTKFQRLTYLLGLAEASPISSLAENSSMSDEMSDIFKCFHKDKNVVHWLKVFV